MTSPISSHQAIEPFFFGPTDQQLFACFHEPAEPARDCGVVICYSIWQEYVRSHRACSRLALQLAQAGFPTLRFDYFGTGDSAGEATDATLNQWQTNIKQAIDELRERSGVSTVCLIGLRLGASLATLVAAERRDVTALIVWEPVVNGKHFIEETIHKHQDTIWRFLVQPKNHVLSEQPTELLGHAVGPELLKGINAIDLLNLSTHPAPQMLVIESGFNEPAQELTKHLQSHSTGVTYQQVSGFNFWTEHVEKRLVPNEMLASIVSWMNEVHS